VRPGTGVVCCSARLVHDGVEAQNLAFAAALVVSETEFDF
jgi:hypothetical protein